MNRLSRETSPYLLQHADNPVDWFPWGDEAFGLAEKENLPVLLSVGYSTCHWCHVMAHESFEDTQTAELMNRNFVNIKVDREERPDIDAIYMETLTALTGHGGWPMTVFMTPQALPFYAGTYFPPQRKGNMPGFGEVLNSISENWQNQNATVVKQADEIAQALKSAQSFRVHAENALRAENPDAPGSGTLPDISNAPDTSGGFLHKAFHALWKIHDFAWGGFGSAPKFPQPSLNEIIAQYFHRSGDSDAEMLLKTNLDCMASGGIYDHLGGGFSRYSTDQHWLVPHFEKMLYDNALLCRLYLHGWQITQKPRYLQVLSETVEYAARDLLDESGGFCAGEDADSEGAEGVFYVWDKSEIQTLLADQAEAAMEWYGVTEQGNFENKNILWRPRRADLIRPEEIHEARQKLFTHREGRVRPGRDTKILTEWNAFMVSSLAEAGAALGRREWLDMAENCAEFLCANLKQGNKRWLRSWQGSEARHLACAGDYAALIDAFLELNRSLGKAKWMDEACETADGLLDLFWDEKEGGVFMTGRDVTDVIYRPKDISDTSIPSANSLTAIALLKLGTLTGKSDYLDAADGILDLIEPLALASPAQFPGIISALELRSTGFAEIVITGTDETSREMVREAHSRYLPNTLLAWGEPHDSPLFEGRLDAMEESGKAWICRNYSCLRPISDIGEFTAALEELKWGPPEGPA